MFTWPIYIKLFVKALGLPTHLFASENENENESENENENE
jgi:hypothetical protein